MAITNLTNTTWQINSGWSAESGYGEFNIDGVCIHNGYEDCLSPLYIGYYIDAEDFAFRALANSIICNSNPDAIVSTNSFTISITGGADVTNTNLINWLETNGELISGGEEEEPTTPITKKFTRLYYGAIAHTSNGKRFRKLQYTEYIEPSEPEQPEEPVALDGFFDADGVQIASWDTLVNDYGLDVEMDYTTSNYSSETTSAYYILKSNEEFANVKQTVIPDTVTRIGNCAFYNVGSWSESVIIGNGVTSIGDSAFNGATGVQSVTIGNSVENISNDAFSPATHNFYINSNKLLTLGVINPLSFAASVYFNAYSEDTEVLFDTTTFISKGGSKATKTYNIYTDNTVLKNASLAFVNSYTIVNVYHLDGSEWEG